MLINKLDNAEHLANEGITSPMNYIVRMNTKGSESLKALLKAMYNYHLAAKAICAD